MAIRGRSASTFLIGALGISLAIAGCSGQHGSQSSVVVIHVLDQHAHGIPGVTIRVGEDRKALTDSAGNVRMQFDVTGQMPLTIAKRGYHTDRSLVTLNSGGASDTSVILLGQHDPAL